MKIQIQYIKSDNSEHIIDIAPEDFFDPLAPDENYWQDGVEKYLGAHEYLPCPLSDIKRIQISQYHKDQQRLYRCEYLSSEQVMTQHSVNEFGEEEIICSAKVSENTTHITRIRKDHDGIWETSVNNLITESDNEYPVVDDLIKSI